MGDPAASHEERFELIGELGSGGTGVVYRVHDRLRGHDVALKALRATGPNALYRFKREFRELCDLTHPNLVALHELYAVGDEWMFTMELVEGVQFREWIAADRARLAPALIQLVDALTALHTAGMIHRDVKNSNVLVQPDGRVVLLDFGLVRDSDLVDATHEGAALGTPAYMSPEQAADVPLTAATDWYAVGVMLYEVLTGRKPFRGPASAVLLDKQRIDPIAPSLVAGNVPPELEALCMQMLARDPRRRPRGEEVLAALGAAPSPWTQRIAERATPADVELTRAEELATLRAALAESRGGPVVMMMHGPRGVGRTALLDAFARQAEAAGAVVFAVRIGGREAVPLRGLDQFVDCLTRYLSSLPEAEASALLPRDIGGLARLFPTLKRLRAASRPDLPGAASTPEALTIRAFDAVAEMIRSITALRPVAVLLDDVHHGEVTGARQVVRLLGLTDAPHILLVTSHDDDQADAPAVLQMRRLPGVRDLPLQTRLPSTQR